MEQMPPWIHAALIRSGRRTRHGNRYRYPGFPGCMARRGSPLSEQAIGRHSH